MAQPAVDDGFSAVHSVNHGWQRSACIAGEAQGAHVTVFAILFCLTTARARIVSHLPVTQQCPEALNHSQMLRRQGGACPAGGLASGP